MEEETVDHEYLSFAINLLDKLQMWPASSNNKKNFLQKYFNNFMIALSILAVMADIVTAYHDNNLTIEHLMEQLIALSALFSVFYCSICFMSKKHEIKILVQNLTKFEKYTPKSLIQETDKRISFYSKCFIIYGVVGNMFYALSPLLSYKSCLEERHFNKYGISCGTIVSYVLPFKHNYAPWSQIVFLQQYYTCNLGTVIIMTITMLLSGILMLCNTHLQYLESLILKTSTVDRRFIYEHIYYCVKFHTAIIEYTDEINDSFSLMMLLHICGTSFIISVLGFAILIEANYSNGVRFSMHLAGWFGMLFVICYYGQTLMDKSSHLSIAAYDTLWYEVPFKVRESLCLVLLRSQRPLVLKAAGVNVMSFATFLGVLSTSYSYFTLFLKIKP